MHWEQRNGRRYLYSKKRIGSKVVSIYEGSESPETLAKYLSYLYKRKDNADLFNWMRDQNELENKIQALNKHTINVIKLFLVLNDYHEHKGEWREIRNGE